MGCCAKICGMCNPIGCVNSPKVRKTLLVLDGCLMYVALLASIGGALGLSSEGLMMEQLPWAVSEGVLTDTYLNLWGVKVKAKSGTSCAQDICFATSEIGSGFGGEACVSYDLCTSYSWEDIDEPEHPFAVAFANFTGADDYVKECEDATFAAMPGAVMGCITSFLCIVMLHLRSRWDREKDVGRKCSALLQRLMPVLTSVETLYFYGLKCISEVNDAAPAGVDVMTGNGLYAEGGALVLSLLSFFIHLALPGRGDTKCCRGKPRGPTRVAPGGRGDDDGAYELEVAEVRPPPVRVIEGVPPQPMDVEDIGEQ